MENFFKSKFTVDNSHQFGIQFKITVKQCVRNNWQPERSAFQLHDETPTSVHPVLVVIKTELFGDLISGLLN